MHGALQRVRVAGMGRRKNEHVAREAPTPLADRIEELKRLFPEALSEGKVEAGKLKAILGDAADERPERYSFTWAGKRDAVRILAEPSRGTLVPVRGESVDFDTTSNLFIEGDNLEVLKLLYKSYFGRVKMIFIDPPYNTGNDFVYPDNYRDPLDTYVRLTGQRDVEGNLLAADQLGDRVRDANVNVLTVAANQSHQSYCAQYQAELSEDFGPSECPPKPANARKDKRVRLRKAFMLKPEFQALWKRVSRRTRYAVTVDSEELVREVVTELTSAEVRPPRDEWYRMELFEAEFRSWEEHLVPAERSLYDHVVCDSAIESTFAQELDRRDDVKLFAKLPGWFTVPTPIGDYNPDWAVVVEPRDEFGRPTGEEHLHLVRETKDTADPAKLRPDEARRLECGRKHFIDALGVPFKVCTSVRALL